MDELLGDYGLSVSRMAVSQSNWREDETLSAQINVMSRRQRYQAAYFALRRLQMPLVDIEMPTDWGVDPVALNSLLREGVERLDGEANEGIERAIAELCSAPLFESQVDPEFAESFQLEAINGWLMLGEALGEMSVIQTERIISLAREMADYLDSCMDSSLTVVDGGARRESYLADVNSRLSAYGLGYFGTRNLQVERDCHESILAAPSGEDLLSSNAGHRLVTACDEYSGELSSALRAFIVE
ncbi:hypothetical protein [Streptomyces sp. NPDC002176]|uniref:hypothetical protein n=1 Tax=Streptomyces sp. NPDC002176 TaxID=3364634 RepID=UPI00384DD4B2